MLRRIPLQRKTPLKAKTGFKQRTTGLKRGGKLKKARTDSIGKLKKKLWAITRQIIIKRYGRDCYTCSAKDVQGSGLHCGHYISSSVCSSELRYSLDNLRPQCFRCNIHLSGNWPAYEAHLVADGIDVAELKRRNEATKGQKYDILFYQAKIAEYENILSALSTSEHAR